MTRVKIKCKFFKNARLKTIIPTIAYEYQKVEFWKNDEISNTHGEHQLAIQISLFVPAFVVSIKIPYRIIKDDVA